MGLARAAGAILLLAFGACDGPRAAPPATDSGSAQPSTLPAAATPTTAPSAAASTAPDAGAANTTRVRGPITGQIRLASPRVVVAEPVVAIVEVRAGKDPLPIYVGGDQRNAASYPIRVAMRVLDEHGAVVCDTVSKPVLPSFGGPGSELTIPAGETHRESLVLNSMCPALATPGNYRVILHRRITPLMIVPGPKGVSLSCDLFPVHEGPMPAGLDPRCVTKMDAVPSITSEIALRVDAFDAAALRRGVIARLAEAANATPVDEIARERIRIWTCGWATCSCPSPRPRADDEMLAALGPSLPSGFPQACAAKQP